MISLALAVPLTVVSVLGLLLNSYILFIVIISKQAHNANNLLLLHLGIVDSLLSLTFLLFSAPEMLRGWTVLGLPCSLHGFLFTLLHPVALWTVCGLNCDRYYAITAPLHYGTLVNVRKVMIGLGVAWLVCLVLSMPPLFKVAPFTHNPGLFGCAPDFGQDLGAWWYSVTYISVTWLLPTALILVCNIRVLTIARYHRHRIASAIFEVTISAQVTITHQRNPFLVPANPLFRGRSAVSTVLQLVISFLLLYCPYYSAILWESSGSLLPTWRVHPLVFTVASSLLTCSPPVNGLLYGVKSKILRNTFKNFWRKQMTKCEMNLEIQARTPSTAGSRRPSLILSALPRPASAQLPRRHTSNIDGHRPIQRICSEISWRPNHFNSDLPRSTSCRDATDRLLQPPVSTIDGVVRVAISNGRHASNPNLSATNVFLQRVFGVQHQHNKKNAVIQTVLGATRQSPRIMITRAFSEESEASPVSAKRKEIINKTYSSSTTVLDKKWKKLRYQEEEDTPGSEYSVGSISAQTESESLMLATPKREVIARFTCGGSDDSSSSSTSDEEHSSGNIYFPFDDRFDKSPDVPRKNPTDSTAVNSPLLESLLDEEVKSCDGCVEGLWMKKPYVMEGRENATSSSSRQIDLELGLNFYRSSPARSIFSWPTRRKGGVTKVSFTHSADDLNTGVQF